MEKSTPALAHQTPEGIDGEKYEPLEILIEPFIHLSLNALPDAVRKCVDKVSHMSSFWDSRPDQRRYFAQTHDREHDPKFERENEYFFALGCQRYEIESKKRKWELLAPQNITEEDIKEKKLSALTAQLDALQKQMRAPYTAPEPQAPSVKADSASGGVEPWKLKAQEHAREIIKRDKAKDLYPSQINISDEIAAKFRKDGVMGTDGKPLTGAYIKRHALNGISSTQGKQLSTAISRGK